MRASCEYRYVRFERQTVPLYVLMLVYQYQACDCRAPSTSSIHSSSSANIRNIWRTCGIRSIALLYTTRRVLVRHGWYSHTSECANVKRCRYHAIRGSVVCTWYVSYEYGQYRTLHMVLLYSYRSTLASYETLSYVRIMAFTRDYIYWYILSEYDSFGNFM